MKKYSLLVLMIGTAAMIVVMAKTGATLKTPATPKGILDLEFAYNTEKTATVITAWQSQSPGPAGNIEAAILNTKLDFIFLFFYSLFLFLSCKKIAAINGSKIGMLIAKGALLAGFLDVLENTGMLITLSGNGSAMIAFITTFCSVIKWAFALAAVLYLLAGFIQVVANKKLQLLFA